MKGLMGIKVGMTQVEDSKGAVVPVTVIEAGPCVVIQKKTVDVDGYEAAQIGFVECKEKAYGKAVNGHFKKAGVTPRKHIREIGVLAGDESKAGDTLTVGMFKDVGLVDVSAVTKGKGFQGVVRKFRMAGGPFTHGGHSKRRVGSIGQCSYPARVQKGKKMPGHMGNTRIIVQGLEVISVREEDNILLVKGAVPGPSGGVVTIYRSIKEKAGKS